MVVDLGLLDDGELAADERRRDFGVNVFNSFGYTYRKRKEKSNI